MRHNIFEGDKTPRIRSHTLQFAEIVETAVERYIPCRTNCAMQTSPSKTSAICSLMPRSITDEPITRGKTATRSWVSVVMSRNLSTRSAALSLSSLISGMIRRARLRQKAATDEVIKLSCVRLCRQRSYKKQRLDRRRRYCEHKRRRLAEKKWSESSARKSRDDHSGATAAPNRIGQGQRKAVEAIIKENRLLRDPARFWESTTTDETLVDDIVLASADLEAGFAHPVHRQKRRTAPAEGQERPPYL